MWFQKNVNSTKGLFQTCQKQGEHKSKHKPAAWDRWYNVNRRQGENRTPSLHKVLATLSEEMMLQLERVEPILSGGN